MDQLHYILINKNMFKIMGSYSIKPYGSLLTDIDINQNVYINQSLVERMRQILRRLNRSNFSFLYLQGGEYDDFVLPWKIDTVGSCLYDPKKVMSWFTQFREKKLIDPALYDKIEGILVKPEITIKDLFEVRRLLRPYALMLWSEQEIYRGYKDHGGKRYNLLESLENEKSIMKFIYRYGSEYCSVEMAIVDKKKQFNPFILHDYYRDNTYKVFKSYKWYLDKDHKYIFENANKTIEGLNALKNRIDLIDTLKKYRLISQGNLQYLIVDCQNFAKYLGFPYIPEKSDELLNTLTEVINKTVEKYIDEMIPLVQPRFRKILSIYNIRTKQSKQLVSQQDLQKRFEEGNKCPFFELKLDDLYYLQGLAERLQLDPEKVVECYENIAHQYDMDLSILVNTIFPKNELKLIILENEIQILDKDKVLKTYKKEDINEARLYIISTHLL